jgi:poly(3-hydroxybutyrate) depolymerase
MRLALVAGFLAVATASISCGTSTRSLVIGNVTREFEVYRPSSTCQSSGGSADAFMPGIGAPPATTQSPATAVVLCLHGWRQTGSWACMAMCAPHADAHGYIAVCPSGTVDGVNSLTGWNTDEASAWSSVDDVGFFRAAVADVHARANVVQNTTYAIGFSMGGGMIYRLMCEASDLFSGFSVVAQYGPWAPNAGIGSAHGASWVGNCTPAAPRPFWASVGTSDRFFDATNARLGWEGMSRTAKGCSGEPELTLNVSTTTPDRSPAAASPIAPAASRPSSAPTTSSCTCTRRRPATMRARRRRGGRFTTRRRRRGHCGRTASRSRRPSRRRLRLRRPRRSRCRHLHLPNRRHRPCLRRHRRRHPFLRRHHHPHRPRRPRRLHRPRRRHRHRRRRHRHPPRRLHCRRRHHRLRRPLRRLPLPHRHRLRRRRLRRPRHRRPQCRRRRCRPLLHCTAW